MKNKYSLAINILILQSFLLILTPANGNAGAEKISISEAEKIVLTENPGLQAALKEVKARQSAVASSVSLDDPKIKLGVNNLPAANPNFKDSDMTSKEIGLSQMFPLGGKLSSRRSIAEIEYNIAKEMYRKEKTDAITSLRVNFYELAFIRESIVINEDIKEQLKLLISVQNAANTAGTGTLDAVARAYLEYATAEEEIIILNQKEKQSLEAISYLAGRKTDIITDFPQTEPDAINTETAAHEILKYNPDLAISRLELEKYRNEVSLAEKNYIPDAELGVSYMQRDDGPIGTREDMISGMMTFNIPVWIPMKNRPTIDEKKAGRDKSEYLVKDKINFLLYRAGVIISQIEKWKEISSLYKDQFMPQGGLAFQTSLAAYKTGKTEFMSVIEALRRLLDYRKGKLMAQKEYYINIAELKALTGMEFKE